MSDHTPTSSLVPLRDHQPARLIKGEILRGCNQYHYSTVIRQEIDFGNIRGISTCDAGASFATQFTQRFIQADRTQPGSITNQRFLAALRSSAGVAPEEALLEATMCVESSMAFVMHRFEPITYACHVDAKSPGNSLLVWETNVPKISLRAVYVALIGLTSLLPAELRASYPDASAEFTSSYAALENDATRYQISMTTSVILLAAKARKIACEHLDGPHVRLGQGAAQRMLYASVLSDTSHAATQLSRDKAKTLRTLAQLGLPVPAQIRVASVDLAIEAAEKLGYPVVVKPLKGKQAGGVTVGVESPHELALAFARAHTSGSDVLVESFVVGATYRLLVMGGRCVAALCIVPTSVLGDGKHSIEELIVALNDDPLRNSVRLFKVAIDEDLTATLNRQGYGLDSVPSNGTPIMLRSAANVAVGGIHTDVTDLVHPANRAMAERAAQAIGLAVAGIDFLTRDISLPYDDVGGNIIQVNARPGLCMHTFPRYGEGRSVAADLLQLVFPGANAGRIPIAMLVGRLGRTTALFDEYSIRPNTTDPSYAPVGNRCAHGVRSIVPARIVVPCGIRRAWAPRFEGPERKSLPLSAFDTPIIFLEGVSRCIV